MRTFKDIFAIIPARGGSKGIRNKNLKEIDGIPLIKRTINIAKESKFINRIFVSTNSQEIATLCQKSGADIIHRPTELGLDQTSSEDVLIHAIEYLEESKKIIPKLVVFLQCTSPFSLTKDIDGTIEKLIEDGADCAFAGADFKHFLWNQKGDFMAGINHDEKVSRQRRQDLKPQYIEAGSVYVFKTSGFLKSKNRFFGKITMNKISPKRILEIDDQFELEMAKNLSKILM